MSFKQIRYSIEDTVSICNVFSISPKIYQHNWKVIYSEMVKPQSMANSQTHHIRKWGISIEYALHILQIQSNLPITVCHYMVLVMCCLLPGQHQSSIHPSIIRHITNTGWHDAIEPHHTTAISTSILILHTCEGKISCMFCKYKVWLSSVHPSHCFDAYVIMF